MCKHILGLRKKPEGVNLKNLYIRRYGKLPDGAVVSDELTFVYSSLVSGDNLSNKQIRKALTELNLIINTGK